MYSRVISILLLGTLVVLSSPFSSARRMQSGDDPKVIETKAPVYPAIAFAAHASGTVLVDVEVDPEGKVTSARAISGSPLLLAASRNAALGWRFQASSPATTSSKVQLKFDFDPDASRCNRFYTITPYHLRIAPDSPRETISYVANYSETHCRVHGTRLLHARVEIIYGLLDTPKKYEEVEKKFFPNANSEVFGGCLVEKETCDGVEKQWNPKYAEVLYCPKCRLARQQWLKKHRLRRTES
jgi:TonB family protein